MLDKSVIEALRAIVGEKHVLTRKVDLVTYSFDATADVPRQIPDVVVMPAGVSSEAMVFMVGHRPVKS